VHDVVAETFTTAWRRLDDVPADALPWLFATARRHIANRDRSVRRRQALHDRLAWTPQPEEVDVADIDDRIIGAIRRLPPREREALMLVAWDGLTPARAARAAGCSSTAFRVRLHRARSRLKSALGSLGSDPSFRSRGLPNSQMEEAQ
jgi:RNA polymerase sigma-70 factor, ECF subfamily